MLSPASRHKRRSRSALSPKSASVGKPSGGMSSTTAGLLVVTLLLVIGTINLMHNVTQTQKATPYKDLLHEYESDTTKSTQSIKRLVGLEAAATNGPTVVGKWNTPAMPASHPTTVAASPLNVPPPNAPHAPPKIGAAQVKALAVGLPGSSNTLVSSFSPPLPRAADPPRTAPALPKQPPQFASVQTQSKSGGKMKGGCEEYPSTDFFGHDLNNNPGKAGSFEQCCDECRRTPECRAFVYRPQGGACFLKGTGYHEGKKSGMGLVGGVVKTAPAVPALPKPKPAPVARPAPVRPPEPTPTNTLVGTNSVAGKVDRGDLVLHRKYHLGNFLKNEDTSDVCFSQYSWGALADWEAKSKEFCSSSSESATTLTCRVTKLSNLPLATSPHTLCDAKNLIVDFEKFVPSPCAKHRPGYFCGEKTYFQYNKGAFGGPCTKTAEFSLQSFPRDHLRDIFDGFADTTEADYGVLKKNEVAIIDTPTVFITRERGEHVNMFHTMTDFLNAFITIEMMKWDAGKVKILFLDDHPTGRFDDAWNTIFATSGKVLRAGQLIKQKYSKALFKHAAFSPPGYTSFLLAELSSKVDRLSCKKSLGVLSSFSDFMLTAYGLQHPRPAMVPHGSLRVVLVVRRPYAGHTHMSRQFANEDELIATLKAMPTVKLEVVDLATMSWQKQMATLSTAELLIGMHGAGLTHLLWMPSYGGVVELRSHPGGGWWCFGHMSLWKGLLYEAWESPNDQGENKVQVNVDAFKGIVNRLIPQILERKQDARAGPPSQPKPLAERPRERQAPSLRNTVPSPVAPAAPPTTPPPSSGAGDDGGYNDELQRQLLDQLA